MRNEETLTLDPDQPPPPLLTSEPGSFAENTIATRKPGIIRQVLSDHDGQYPPEIVTNLEALLEEILARQPIQPLDNSFACNRLMPCLQDHKSSGACLGGSSSSSIW